MVSNIYANSFLPNVKKYNINPNNNKNKGANQAINPDAQGQHKQEASQDIDGSNNSNSLNKLLTSDNNDINVTDILKDFKSTMTAIGVPRDTGLEIMEHLKKAHIEASQNNPGISKIQGDLCKAAEKLDSYISETLGKPSTVVKQWLDALLLQKVTYTAADPLPPEVLKKAAAKTTNNSEPGVNPSQSPRDSQNPMPVQPAPENTRQPLEAEIVYDRKIEPVEIKNSFEINEQSSLVPTPKEVKKPDTDLHFSIADNNKSSKNQHDQANSVNTEVQTNTLDNTKNIEHSKSLYKQAHKELTKGNYQKALKLYNDTLAYASEINDEKTMLRTHNDIARLYDETLDTQNSLKHYNEALQIASRTNNTRALAKLHYNTGSIYEDTGKYPQALKHYQASIAFDNENENISGQALSLTNIGNILAGEKNYRGAIENYHRAHILAKETGDREAQAHILSNIGSVYQKAGYPVKAFDAYQQALMLDKETVNLEGFTKNLFNIGLIYEQSGDIKLAKQCFQKVMGNARKLHDHYLSNYAFEKLNAYS
jgi:tetratricopeptide (TPR) repeat protein